MDESWSDHRPFLNVLLLSDDALSAPYLMILYHLVNYLEESIANTWLSPSPDCLLTSLTLYITTEIYPIIDIQNHRRTEATQRLPNFLQGLLIWGVEY